MKIERSNQKGRFTTAELRSNVRESNQYWNSPEGKRKAAELEREKRNRQPVSVADAERAKRTSLKPQVSTRAATAKAIRELEFQAAKNRGENPGDVAAARARLAKLERKIRR